MSDTRRLDHSELKAVVGPPSATFEQKAVEARRIGDFTGAADLFAAAAGEAEDEQTSLHLQLRQAFCLIAIDRHEEAAALARVVTQRARAEQYLPELIDALGVFVDDHLRTGRLAEAAHVMSEAMYLLDRLPNEVENYLVIHNMASTYTSSGFVKAALDLFDRALRLAPTDDARQFTYASMASAYHYAAQREPDPLERNRLLHDGLYAATAALDPTGATEVLAVGTALSHRSMMLAEIGHYEAALTDAPRLVGSRPSTEWSKTR